MERAKRSRAKVKSAISPYFVDISECFKSWLMLAARDVGL